MLPLPITDLSMPALFIGSIVGAMQRQHEVEVDAEHGDARADVTKFLKEVRTLRELRANSRGR